MLALAGVAFGDPAHWISRTVVASLVLGFAGATQDVTVDGWRITAAPPGKQSLMTAFSEAGYRFGTLAAGAGALIAADRYGWRVAYMCMAALMTIGALSAIFAPEPESDLVVRRDHPGVAVTIITPIKELMGRLGPWAVPVLLLIAGFRMPGYLSSAMSMPLFKSRHSSSVGLASEPRVASRHRPGRLPPLRRRRKRRGLGLFLCAGRAHHLHVLARIDGARRQPICADDFALRTAGKLACGRLGLRHRAYGLRGFLHRHVADRHSRRAARLVRLAQSSAGRGLNGR